MRPEVVSVAAVAKREKLPVAYFSNTNSGVDYSGIGVDVISFKAESNGYTSMQGEHYMYIKGDMYPLASSFCAPVML